MNYPYEIKRIRRESARLKRKIKTVRERMVLIEAKETLAVVFEVNEQGKLIFFNEQTRRAAVAIRLESVNEYTRWQRELHELESERVNLDAQLKLMWREFILSLLDMRL